MKSPNYQLPTTNSEQGATIIVAIILLATMAFISFSLSTVLLRGIRTSRLLQNTELAIAGANSGIEVSLYRFLRNAGGLGVTDVALSSNNGATFSVTPDLTDDPYNFSVAAGDQIYINLYNPENISANPGYGSVVITNAASSRPIRVDVVPWSDSSSVTCAYSSIPAGGAPACNLLAEKYQIIIEVNGGTGQASGTIKGWSGPGATGDAMGIPSDAPVLDVIGKMTEVQRRIRVDLVNL